MGRLAEMQRKLLEVTVIFNIPCLHLLKVGSANDGA